MRLNLSPTPSGVPGVVEYIPMVPCQSTRNNSAAVTVARFFRWEQEGEICSLVPTIIAKRSSNESPKFSLRPNCSGQR